MQVIDIESSTIIEPSAEAPFEGNQGNYTFIPNVPSHDNSDIIPYFIRTGLAKNSQELLNHQAIFITGTTYSLPKQVKPILSIETNNYDPDLAFLMDEETKRLHQNLIDFYNSYQQELFDTEISEEFSHKLENFIRENGPISIHLISKILHLNNVNDDIKAETLKALGRINDNSTDKLRYKLLIDYLKSESITIRDGSVCGLSYFDDPQAISQLKALHFIESSPIMKNNIKVAINGLATNLTTTRKKF